MDAIFKMMGEASRLERAAKTPDASAAELQEIMLASAKTLMEAAEKAAPLWGELAGTIKALEKGK
jgi:hypothetical protein